MKVLYLHELEDKRCAPFTLEVRTSLVCGAHFSVLSSWRGCLGMWMRCRETQAFLEVAVREILERDPDARAKAIQDGLGVSLRTARLLKKVRG